MAFAFLFLYKIENKMATIAKAMITLTNVNDAYSVVSSPDSCVIKADFDGTNPNLDAAFTDITVFRGETKHTYKLEIVAVSNSAITYSLGTIDAYTKRIKLTNIPSDTLSGYLSFTVSTNDDYVATVTFQYSVVRESSMLDWILDWENNKTKIGDTYLITPKLFVGKKVENEDGLKSLTGVYIGPDTVNTAGIYGYKEGEDVFHINALGAMIGGWEINKAGISTSNEHGYVKLLSDGNMSYSNIEGDVVWKLFDNGDATFAQGNVSFSANGDATFNGKIIANSGSIAGWGISSSSLSNEYIRLDSASRLIGVCGHQSTAGDGSGFISDIQLYGGVYMNYTASANYGLRGYLPGVMSDGVLTSKQVFALGSENKIANWYFDNDSLYMGTKVNVTRSYTSSSSYITIGSQGLRGNSWYIDNDGSVSFAKGMVTFNESGGTIVGWNLQTNRFGSAYAVLVSDSALAGLYLSKSANLSNVASSSLQSTIKSKGGIYLCTNGSSAELYASDGSANQTFYITTNGTNKIANWYFDKDAIYTGTKTTSGFVASSGITLGTGGIRGCKWKLESDGSASFCNGYVTFNADGSGSFANGNIKWDSNGAVTFEESVNKTLSSSLIGSKLTKIDANGIYTGTLSANQVNALSCTFSKGTIGGWTINSNSISRNDVYLGSNGSIYKSDYWALNADGTGSLACGKISWDTAGWLTVSGGTIGGWVINGKELHAGTGAISFDAENKRIRLECSSSQSSYNLNSSFGAILTMDCSSGIIQASALKPPSYSTAIAYMSSNGIFSNMAGINGMSGSSGYTHRGAIVGLGFANVDKSTWSMNADETVVAGVYGRASNSGTADAYGGFFYQLKACGLITSIYYFGDNDNNTQLSLDKTTVIGLVNSDKTCVLYLPKNAHEGQEVEIIQMGAGVTRIDTNDGTLIYDDTSVNDYYDCGEGWVTICKRVRYNIGNTTYNIWAVHQYRY